ncbi:MAG: hypothetical protein JWM74_43 [Myxococcaceae bacterium]|nr:hypothetical protein [Myxococcaceae bacterium]
MSILASAWAAACNPHSTDDGTSDADVNAGDASVDGDPDGSVEEGRDGDALPDAEDARGDGTSHADATDAPVVVVDAGPPPDCTALGPEGEPLALGCTGLYSSWQSQTIAPDVVAFDPGIHLWSDGAEKSRWIQLPAGQQINTSNMNEWTFPVGTKLWKEFRLNGLKVETRLTWKKSASVWVRVAYAWSVDQSTATELRAGAKNVRGTTYEIPSAGDCSICHNGRLDGVLGFEAIGLSTPGATGLNMAALVAQNKLTNSPASPLVIPGTPTDVAALGWLHANCGTSCHSPSNYALAKDTGLFMRLDAAKLGSVPTTDTYQTAVNVPSTFQPSAGAGFFRIKPKDAAHSCIPYRDGIRDPNPGDHIQMPPLATHIVDTAGVGLVTSWIDSL